MCSHLSLLASFTIVLFLGLVPLPLFVFCFLTVFTVGF
jgi:hypothetical protein